MRRLITVACAVIFVDVAFFEAITPLLADYRNQLGLGEGEAGLLVGSYAVGSVLFSLPAGFAASRLGPRRVIVPGLVIFGLSGAAFGLVDEIGLLVSTRFLQGAAGAALWAGAMTWMINSAPAERRGAVIGIALGSAVAGALFGPVIGALAGEVGTEYVFGAVLVVSLALAAATLSIEDVTVRVRTPARAVASAITTPRLVAAAGMVIAPSVMLGSVAVLVPLRIDDLGGSSLLVAVGFAAGAAVEASLSPLMGRLSDRYGRMLPFAAGSAVGAVAILLVPMPSIPLVLGALIGTAMAAGSSFAPASARLSDMAEGLGLHQGFATAVANMAWAIGQVIGALVGGALTELAGPLVPCLAVSVMLAGAALAARRRIAIPSTP